MSGTYSIDGFLLADNPGVKGWRFDAGRRRKGNGVGQQPPFFTVDWEFPPLAVGTGTTLAFLAEKYDGQGKHAVVMGHPSTGYLTMFSGVTIDAMTYQLGDIDDDGWAQGVKLTLGHISTGNMYPIEKQPYWWFGNNRDYVVSLSGSQDSGGTVLSLTVLLTNNDTRSLAEIVTTIPTPAGLTYSTAIGNGTFDDATGEWTLSGLDGGNNASMAITYAIDVAGDYTLTATTDATPYTNENSSNDTDTITIDAPPPWWLANGVVAGDVYGAYNPVSAASYADSLVNRNDPGVNDLTTGVAPNWDALTGWDFTGTQYLVSGFYPAQDMTIVMALSETVIRSNYLIGEDDTNHQFYWRTNYNTGISRTTMYFTQYELTERTAYFVNGALLTDWVLGNTNGTEAGYYLHRFFYNGVYESQLVSYSAFGTPARPAYIGAVNNGGVPTLTHYGRIRAVAIYNTTLTDEQIATISANMGSLF